MPDGAMHAPPMHRPCTAHAPPMHRDPHSHMHMHIRMHAHMQMRMRMQVPTVPYPFVLKPCCEDNSMGISKVE